MDFQPLDPIQGQIKTVFEPRYGRGLEDVEVETIAQNLLAFAEAVSGVGQDWKRRLGDWGAAGTNKRVGGLDG